MSDETNHYEAMAVAMWAEDARRVNMPATARRRTLARFREEAPETQAKWLGFARAASPIV